MRRDIQFTSHGLKCAAWLYVPDGLAAGAKAPTIVMAHGFSAVKEMYLYNFAERFSQAGFVCLVFDYRYFGGSEGEPRCQLFPWEQIEDYRNAITFASELPEVDASRIGIWGTSYSGSHVLCVGALDRRVKCVVSQVPLVDGLANAQRLLHPEPLEGFLDWLAQDRIERYKTGKVNTVPVVAPAGQPCALPHAEGYEWFIKAGETVAPSWRNEVTVESLEKFLEYSPIAFIHRISPTPLLMVVAEKDTITPTDLAVQAYLKAGEPKKIVIPACKHFDAYLPPWIDVSAGAAIDWFKAHLI